MPRGPLRSLRCLLAQVFELSTKNVFEVPLRVFLPGIDKDRQTTQRRPKMPVGRTMNAPRAKTVREDLQLLADRDDLALRKREFRCKIGLAQESLQRGESIDGDGVLQSTGTRRGRADWRCS